MKLSQKLIVIATALILAGCANTPSAPDTLSNLQGSYEIVDQFSNNSTHLTRIDVHFTPNDSQGNSGADLTIQNGESVKKYHLDDCGYPGDRVAHDIADSSAPNASEVVRCVSRQNRITRRPVLFLIRSLDGHQLIFHPSGGLITVLTSHPLHSTTGMMAILNWGPNMSNGYMLQRIAP